VPPRWTRATWRLLGARIQLRDAYRRVFTGDDGEPTPAAALILADLRRFCRAETSCWAGTAREHALLEGRREVWLRIQHHLNLTDTQIHALAELAQGETPQETTDD
jgi:hypothetical protein